MRQSSALLPQTQVRLTNLVFPHHRVHIHRTRLAFIHLDNLLHYAKIDRDGRLDGYIAAYLPDQLVMLLLRRGEMINAVSLQETGRHIIPIAQALRDIRDEVERGDLAYYDAPMEQLAWMYTTCAAPIARRFVDENAPASLFPALHHELFSGVLEFISNGRVTYLRFEDGKFVNGYYSGKPELMTVPQYVESLFHAAPDGTRPHIAASVFQPSREIPEQANPAMVETFRDLFWRIAEAADRQAAGEAMKRAYRFRDALAATHPVLPVIGTPRDREPGAVVTSSEQLTAALGDWSRKLLEDLEVIAPGIAPAVLLEATREQRFMLQKAGFFARVPWNIHW